MRSRYKARFETTPVAEALKHALEVDGNPVVRRRPNGEGHATVTTILIVDDEATIADTLSLILQNRGYRTVVAYDGVTALKQYALYRPQMVLSDVMMPGMNGVEMAIAMRERGGCPILLFSGQAVTTDLLATARQRGHDFEVLMKPIHPIELLERIALVIGGDSRPPRRTEREPYAIRMAR